MIPEVIYIETTTLCNADCIMCPHRLLTRPQQTMSQELFGRIVEGIRGYDLARTQVFLHKEGEPLCDESIVERISQVRRELPTAREVGISTNAMLMDGQMADRLIASGLDVIFFSVDGVSPETYERIRRNCKYDVVECNIRRFLEKRNAAGSRIRVVMQMLLSDTNRHEKDAFVDRWKGYGVEFYFKEVHCYLDGGMSSFGTPDFTHQISCCRDPFRVLVYHVDGRAGLCCWDYDCEYVIGLAAKGDMMQIFNSSRSRHMREMQLALKCQGIVPCNRCGRIFGRDRISGY